MRKWLIATLILLVSLLLFTVASADWMAEARGMLDMINDFRTGDSAWYWNKNNKDWTTETGLGKLSYDLELEAVAKVRAQELASNFSHTRPDGSKWSTAYPAGNYGKGENIAYGYTSAAEAFEAWREDDEDYAGQGHRRNMLRRDFTRVGMAAVEINGVVYWVQEFASGSVKQPMDGTWVQEGGVYYYIRDDGSKATGWLQDGNDWYYMNSQGAMQTGWVKDHGKWYFMSSSGAMQTGWQESGGEWYYFGTDGVMQTGWQQIGKKWYLFDKSGAMQTGWQQDGGKWYYFASSGAMQTGWKELGGNWYYFKKSGEMATGTVKIDGNNEVFNASGVWEYTEISDYDTALGGPEALTVRRVLIVLKILMTLWQMI